MNKNVVRIRMDLTDDDAKAFNQLKQKRGLTINTQLVRQLLAEAYLRELGNA